MKKYFCLIIIALAFATSFAAVGMAQNQEEWSNYISLGQGVSVSFLVVNKRTNKPSDWTWRFRNDGSTTITELEFDYVEHKFIQTETKHDIFPGTLEPGKSFGGWAAFLAESEGRPTINITKIRRK